jgi:anti-sigma regulatory factor (Ser/Thr protein kinase)
VPSVPEAGRVFELLLERSEQELARLGTWIDRIAESCTLQPPQEYALRLCVEEAVSNVIMHGQPTADSAVDRVMVRIWKSPHSLQIIVEDACGPFDPLQQAAPDIRAGLDERAIGGLGIHLMRRFSRSMRYRRVHGTNRLTLTIGLDA